MGKENEGHHLRIEVHVFREDFDYLKDDEVVRGVNTKFELNIKNIGSTHFPGGTFIEPRLQSQNVTYHVDKPDMPNIPKIGPGETIQIPFDNLTPMEDGVSWINFKIAANDNEKIYFYQLEDNPPLSGDRFIMPFTVINRELLEILLHHKGKSELGGI